MIQLHTKPLKCILRFLTKQWIMYKVYVCVAHTRGVIGWLVDDNETLKHCYLRRHCRPKEELARLATGFLQRFFELDDLFDSSFHFHDGLVFGESQSPLVGDIVHSAYRLCVFTVDTSGLEVQFGAFSLQS